MRATMGVGEPAYLVTRVGGLACAIPIAHVVEVMRPLPVAPLVEATRAFIRGMAVVRGEAIPVIDAARLLARDAREQARFVVVRPEPFAGRRIAILVDAVLGVRSFDTAKLAELPPLLRDADRDNVTAIGTLDRELFVILDTSRIVSEVAA